MAQQRKSPAIPPLLAIPFGILAVSTSSILIRFGQEEASSLVIAAYRLTLASLILLPVVSLRYRPEIQALTRRDITLGMLSGLFLAIHFATWITSLEYTTVASSVVLVSTTPLWVALLSPITIKEPVSRAVATGLLIALAGGAIVGLSDSCSWNAGELLCPPLGEFLEGEAFLGDLLALSGALAVAAYLMIGRRLRAKMSLMVYIFLAYGGAAVVLVGVMLAAQEAPFGYSPRFYLWVSLLAIVPQLLGHTTFNWALAYLPAAFVSITLLGEPVGSTIWAYYILNETPGVIKIFGAILILAGIATASRRTNQLPDRLQS
jgi:drug/metabolite transporter (DMT)-like permease